MISTRNFNDYLIYVSDEMMKAHKRIAYHTRYNDYTHTIEREKDKEYLRGLYNGVVLVKNMLLHNDDCYVSYLNELLDMYDRYIK